MFHPYIPTTTVLIPMQTKGPTEYALSLHHLTFHLSLNVLPSGVSPTLHWSYSSFGHLLIAKSLLSPYLLFGNLALLTIPSTSMVSMTVLLVNLPVFQTLFPLLPILAPLLPHTSPMLTVILFQSVHISYTTSPMNVRSTPIITHMMFKSCSSSKHLHSKSINPQV